MIDNSVGQGSVSYRDVGHNAIRILVGLVSFSETRHRVILAGQLKHICFQIENGPSRPTGLDQRRCQR